MYSILQVTNLLTIMLPGTADNLLDKPDEELVNLPWKP